MATMTYAEFGPSDEIEGYLEQELGAVIGEFEITTIPEGGAPEDVRSDWFGAKLPFRTYGLQERPHVLYDEITNTYKENFEQIAIFGLDAVVALRKLDRNYAADWWVQNGYAFGSLVFRGSEGNLTIFPADSSEV